MSRAATPTPALLTSTSRPPRWSTASLTDEAAAAGSAASAATNAAPGPSACTARSPRPGSRPVITTRAPSPRNRPAMARPRPVVPPVTSARLPSRTSMAAQSRSRRPRVAGGGTGRGWSPARSGLGSSVLGGSAGERAEPADDPGGRGDVRAEVPRMLVLGGAEVDHRNVAMHGGEVRLTVPGIGVDGLLVMGSEVEPGGGGGCPVADTVVDPQYGGQPPARVPQHGEATSGQQLPEGAGGAVDDLLGGVVAIEKLLNGPGVGSLEDLGGRGVEAVQPVER